MYTKKTLLTALLTSALLISAGCGNNETPTPPPKSDCDTLCADQLKPNMAGVCDDAETMCVRVRCKPGYIDLNGNLSDGCEATCTLSNGGVEICDGKDNNCDGVVDNVTDPEINRTVGEVCGVGACAGEGVWACPKPGEAAPEKGQLVCDLSNSMPTEEVCDGIDNDCDGELDESFPEQGDACTAGVGVCAVPGQTICMFGAFACEGPENMPEEQEEKTCDGKDNDCDGEVDEGCDDDGDDYCDADMIVAEGATCANGGGDCHDDHKQSYPGSVHTACDMRDNDCNGDVDDFSFVETSVVKQTANEELFVSPRPMSSTERPHLLAAPTPDGGFCLAVRTYDDANGSSVQLHVIDADGMTQRKADHGLKKDVLGELHSVRHLGNHCHVVFEAEDTLYAMRATTKPDPAYADTATVKITDSLFANEDHGAFAAIHLFENAASPALPLVIYYAARTPDIGKVHWIKEVRLAADYASATGVMAGTKIDNNIVFGVSAGASRMNLSVAALGDGAVITSSANNTQLSLEELDAGGARTRPIGWHRTDGDSQIQPADTPDVVETDRSIMRVINVDGRVFAIERAYYCNLICTAPTDFYRVSELLKNENDNWAQSGKAIFVPADRAKHDFMSDHLLVSLPGGGLLFLEPTLDRLVHIPESAFGFLPANHVASKPDADQELTRPDWSDQPAYDREFDELLAVGRAGDDVRVLGYDQILQKFYTQKFGCR